MAGVFQHDEFSSTSQFSFADLEAQARAALDQARQHAHQIVAEAEERARQRAAKLEAEAHARGLEEGRQQGLEQTRSEAARTALQEARENLSRLSEALSTGLAMFEEGKGRLLASAQASLIKLALAIARRVCKHDVASSSAAALANASTLLKMVEHQDDLELHLNPAECDALRQVMPELHSATGRLTHVHVVADPAVERGGCVLRTRAGTIDAAIETQLERVSEALLAVCDNEH